VVVATVVIFAVVADDRLGALTWAGAGLTWTGARLTWAGAGLTWTGARLTWAGAGAEVAPTSPEPEADVAETTVTVSAPGSWEVTEGVGSAVASTPMSSSHLQNRIQDGLTVTVRTMGTVTVCGRHDIPFKRMSSYKYWSRDVYSL
jgi:hypothetical protein